MREEAAGLRRGSGSTAVAALREVIDALEQAFGQPPDSALGSSSSMNTIAEAVPREVHIQQDRHFGSKAPTPLSQSGWDSLEEMSDVGSGFVSRRERHFLPPDAFAEAWQTASQKWNKWEPFWQSDSPRTLTERAALCKTQSLRREALQRLIGSGQLSLAAKEVEQRVRARPPPEVDQEVRASLKAMGVQRREIAEARAALQDLLGGTKRQITVKGHFIRATTLPPRGTFILPGELPHLTPPPSSRVGAIRLQFVAPEELLAIQEGERLQAVAEEDGSSSRSSSA